MVFWALAEFKMSHGRQMGCRSRPFSSIGILLYSIQNFDTAPYERLPVPEQMVFSVAYSPDGRLLAGVSGPYSGSLDVPMIVRLWDAAVNLP